jgi:hypothetical protein
MPSTAVGFKGAPNIGIVIGERSRKLSRVEGGRADVAEALTFDQIVQRLEERDAQFRSLYQSRFMSLLQASRKSGQASINAIKNEDGTLTIQDMSALDPLLTAATIAARDAALNAFLETIFGEELRTEDWGKLLQWPEQKSEEDP